MNKALRGRAAVAALRAFGRRFSRKPRCPPSRRSSSARRRRSSTSACAARSPRRAIPSSTILDSGASSACRRTPSSATASSAAPAPASSSMRRTATSSPMPTSCKNASEITVTLVDDVELKAEVVGADERSDVAVLRVKDAKLPAEIALADSSKLQVGDFVIAIGNPVRPAAHGDVGHRERARPHRHQPRRPRGLHPDRRRDQSRQLGRRARRPRRRAGRHQLRDPVAVRRQHRHRLRDSRPTWSARSWDS